MGSLVLWLLLACPVWGAGEPLTARLPEPGTTLERALTADAAHSYPLERRSGEELWITVVQDGVDVVVALVGADGEPRLEVDSPGGMWGEEWLLVAADTPEGSRLEVRSLEPHGAPGRYGLRVESSFPAQDVDPRQQAARQAMTEAGRLTHRGDRVARGLALEHYGGALALWQALGDERPAARTLFLLGTLHRRLDQPSEALTRLRQALAEWQRLGDRVGQAQTLREVAVTTRMQGEFEGAEETSRQALDLWRELADLAGQAQSFNDLGLIRARSAPTTAFEHYGRALDLFRELGDVGREGVLLNNIGGLHYLTGEPHRALEHYRLALDIHRRLGDLEQQAAVWNNVAAVHRQAGRFQDALEGYGAALEVSRQLDDRRGQGRTLNNLGSTWLGLGDPERARDAFQEALPLRRATGDRRGEAISLQNLALALTELDEKDRALEVLSRSLALRRDLGDRVGEATALGLLGDLRSGTPEAVRHQRDALAILEELDLPWLQAIALWRLGKALTAGGEPEEAMVALDRSLALFREVGDEVGEGDGLVALARAERAAAAGQQRATERLVAAHGHAIAALDLLDSVRAEVDSLGLRASFLSRHTQALEFAVGLAMELEGRAPGSGWAARGFELSERARARSLLDLLDEAGASVRRGVDPVLLERQQVLLERLGSKVERRRRHLRRQRGGPNPVAASARLAREANQIRGELEAVENEIRRQSPAWDALAHPRPLDADAVRALLDPETTLLEYSLGEERSFLWVVTSEEVQGFELPARATIEAVARQVHEALRILDPRAHRTDAEAAGQLSEMLLAPVAEHLVGPRARRLVIVADGALHYLPFAALRHPADGEPLLTHHQLVSLPSASALGVQRQTLAGRPPAGKALAILADPVFGPHDSRLSDLGGGSVSGSGVLVTVGRVTVADAAPAYRDARAGEFRLERLAWSGWEAEAIARHAGEGQTFLALGFDAELDAVRGGALEGYRVVHFATHGIVESEHPELSALILSLVDTEGQPQEGFLRLPEIYNLRLDADLVVLSGCRTALGPEVRGEGLVGLTRGFFAAGAQRLVASLWRVQDHSAAELMDRFYRRLLRDPPLPPAAALRQAQLEMLREPEFRDPYHWAAFALYGDWR